MYTVLNFHWTPNQFSELSRKEKAFVVACIDKRVKAEEAEANKVRGM